MGSGGNMYIHDNVCDDVSKGGASLVDPHLSL